MVQLERPWMLPEGDTHFIPYARQNSYQGDIYDQLYEICDTHDIAIDVGAHVGFFTRRFSADFNTVMAFEPVPMNYVCLESNITDLDNVIAMSTGVGDIGTKELYQHKESNSGSWSWLRPETEKDVQHGKAVMMALDLFSFTGRVSAIKLDIQGMELEALRSAEHLLTRHKPAICVEVKSDTYAERFKDVIEEYLTGLGAHKVAEIRHDIFLKW